jgi:hypothetical protein
MRLLCIDSHLEDHQGLVVVRAAEEAHLCEEE